MDLIVVGESSAGTGTQVRGGVVCVASSGGGMLLLAHQ